MQHIGKLIKIVFDKHPKDHTVTWLASKLHCNRRNIYDIFSRANIDVYLLARISKILEHDFFKDISDTIDNPGEQNDATK